MHFALTFIDILPLQHFHHFIKVSLYFSLYGRIYIGYWSSVTALTQYLHFTCLLKTGLCYVLSSVMNYYNQKCLAVYSIIFNWIQYLALRSLRVSRHLIKTFA